MRMIMQVASGFNLRSVVLFHVIVVICMIAVIVAVVIVMPVVMIVMDRLA